MDVFHKSSQDLCEMHSSLKGVFLSDLKLRYHVTPIGMYDVCMYSVFTINVPLAVRFATAAISLRKTEPPEYGRFDKDFH